MGVEGTLEWKTNKKAKAKVKKSESKGKSTANMKQTLLPMKVT